MILKRSGLTAPAFRSLTLPDSIGRLLRSATYLFAQVFDVMLPRVCMLCGDPLPGPGALCRDCYGRFETIPGPVCTCCGAVFPSPQGSDHLCGECIARPAHYDCARSAGVYAGELRRAIQQFKFRRGSMLAGPLAEFAANLTGLGRDGRYDALVPVPLHTQRLRSRGYNQSLLLAQGLGRLWSVPVERDFLLRISWRVPQASLSRQQRRRAVAGAFACRDRRHAGARLLLVDDVFTSGATVNECARTLKRCGAAAVDVLTVARTLKDHPECQLLSA